MPGFPPALGMLRDKASALFKPNQQYEEFEMPDQQQYSQMPSDVPPNLRSVPPPNLGYNKAEEATFGPGGDLPGTPNSAPEIERPPLRHIDKYIRPECPCLSKRYTVAVLTCVGFIISFGMRCNMGMAKLQFEHREKSNSSDGVAPIKWSVGVESAVDSSFFWGYLVTQVPGGFLASKYPANRIFGTAIACSSFLNLLVPGATMLHPTFLIMVRILQGLVEGVTYPACHGIWRFWAPPLERSRLATLAFCGSYAGVVLGMPLSGLLTGFIGWQAPFYFYGVCGLIWFVVWLWLTFEKPRYHPSISAGELLYIEQSIGETTNVAMPTIKTTPWRAFLTSMPVHAIIVANICRSWNFYFLVLFQAAYLQTFHLKIAETGFVGALPHLLMAIIVPGGGLLADHVRKKGILTTTNVRKLFNCGGFGMEALFFLVVAYANSAAAATAGLTFGVAFSGFAISGYNVNHLDIAPRYASILMGMSNGIGTIAGLICPIVIDHITSDHSRESWKTAFILAACVHFFGVTFYAIFASGELQSWAEPTAAEIASWGPPDDPNAQKKLAITPAAPPPRPAPPPQHPPAVSTNPFLSYGDPAPSYGALESAQINSDWGNSSYGSMGDSGSMPPIPYSNHVESVQPESRDYYQQPGAEEWPINQH
ncbi:vesicular glutamate transporter 1 [Neocloeon triangulifer]|uniref:vesicular glutamate transporter 1 n=1 Tax=Neocloeon triangulifer TaxID=2078957 RepID=UPI00286EBEED|nr:vesicular glutamate transporter 1 [Neocloeon triangulifer]